jgi:hypothetical protein
LACAIDLGGMERKPEGNLDSHDGRDH